MIFIPFLLLLIVNVNKNIIFVVDAWQVCSSAEGGGGICPDGSTCCPTDIPGISSCIPGRHKDPDNAKGECCAISGTGIGIGRTGCGYGYECALKFATDTETEVEVEGNDNEEEEKEKGKEEKIEEEVCKLRDPHPSYLNAPVTPRYELCQLPSSSSSSSLSDVLKLHGFPVDGYNAAYYSSMGSIANGDNNEKDNNNSNNDQQDYMKKFSSIETILVIVHGSGRNADEYLCAGMSLADMNMASLLSENENENENEKEKVLVIAPKFVADIDIDVDINQENHQEDNDDLFLNNNNNNNNNNNSSNYSDIPNILYWAERGPDLPLWHTWRYGADALNTTKGISSYTVMDRLLEYLIESKQNKQKQEDEDNEQGSYYNFPNLKKISVMGHSAGGQYVHRWALLSSNPIIWGDDNDDNEDHDDDNGNDDGNGNDGNNNTNVRSEIEVRTVVANPRSYCYLDDRRMIRKDGNNNDYDYDVDGRANANANANVNTNDNVTNYEHDHEYDDRGDYIDNDNYYVFAVPDRQDVETCPTYDQWQWGLEQGGNITCPYKDDVLKKYSTNTISSRYANRNVFYLTGEYDTIEQIDSCETYNFQGSTRNERAKRYFYSLKEYFKEESTSSLLHQQLHQVSGSPHDDTLMFQSKPGLEAIFGSNYIMDNEKEEEEYNSENMIEKVIDDDDDGGGDTLYSERTSIARHPSLLLMRLKEIMVNLCFSTSSGELVRRNNGDGFNLRAKKGV